MVLNYSNGRGRGPTAQGSGGLPYSTRAGRSFSGRGKSGSVRGRSLTWTNPFSVATAGYPPANVRSSSPTRAAQSNRVWINTAVAETPVGDSSSAGGNCNVPTTNGGNRQQRHTGTGSVASAQEETVKLASSSAMTISSLGPSKAGNRVWRNAAATRISSRTDGTIPSNMSSESSGSRREPAGAARPTSTASVAQPSGVPVHAIVTTSKANNRVWTSASNNGITNNATASTKTTSASGFPRQNPLSRSGINSVAVSTSKAGNRVWTNTSKNNVSFAATRTLSEINERSRLGRSSSTSDRPLARAIGQPGSPKVSTSKAGNRVWTSATSAASGGSSREILRKQSPAGAAPSSGLATAGARLNHARTSGPFVRRSPHSLPSFANMGVASSTSGNLVWTNPGAVAGCATTKATSVRAHPIPATSGPHSAIVPPSAVGTVGKTSARGAAGGAKLKFSTAVSPPAGSRGSPLAPNALAKPQVATSASASAATTTPISRYSASSIRKLPKTQSAVVPDTAARVAKPVSRYSHSSAPNQQPPAPAARYSGSANRHLILKASVHGQSGSVGMSGSERRTSSAAKAGTVGKILRYSGARGGHGQQLSSGRHVGMGPSAGRGAGYWRGWSTGAPDREALRGRGYYKWAFGQALPVRGEGRDYVQGRGMTAVFSLYQRPYGVPWRGMYPHLFPWPRGNHAAKVASLSRYPYPAAGWAARWAPWAAGRGGWESRLTGGRPRIRRVSRPPKSKLRFKNRTLIRARSLILPQSASIAQASVHRATVAVAAARRASFVRIRPVLGTAKLPLNRTSTPTRFVRSGKHGMAIRRVNSVDLAARRAAAARAIVTATTTATASTVTSAGQKRKEGESNGFRPASTAIAGAAGSRKADTTLDRGSKIGGARATIATPRVGLASPTVTPRRTDLLKKLRERSSVVVGSRRKAAAAVVVAGARAMRARVVGRNMTLYRGKEEEPMARRSTAEQEEASASAAGASTKENRTKSKREKTEPCLFFCKFGKCSKSDEGCRFIHDKSKVAVCRMFLKGSCTKGEDCLLTHAVQAEKMPVCIYFEKGMCFTPNCPYLHVKVSKSAAICPNFSKVRNILSPTLLRMTHVTKHRFV